MNIRMLVCALFDGDIDIYRDKMFCVPDEPLVVKCPHIDDSNFVSFDPEVSLESNVRVTSVSMDPIIKVGNSEIRAGSCKECGKIYYFNKKPVYYN